jgi:hypothetical protein
MSLADPDGFIAAVEGSAAVVGAEDVSDRTGLIP